MQTWGSMMLIVGAGGMVVYLAMAALRPRLLPKRAAVMLAAVLLVLVVAGLVMLTVAGGSRSLHTGG